MNKSALGASITVLVCVLGAAWFALGPRGTRQRTAGAAPDAPATAEVRAGALPDRAPPIAPSARGAVEVSSGAPSASIAPDRPIGTPAYRGTVVDQAGQPVAGATVVLLEPLEGADRERASARALSDAEGRYALPAHEPAVRRAVAVVAAGYGVRRRNQLPDVDAPFEVRRAVVCRGRLIGPASIVRGASVRGVRTTWDGEVLEHVAAELLDAQGAFAIEGALGSSVDLDVTLADGERFVESVELDAALVLDGVVTHDVDVSEVAVRLEGRVVEAGSGRGLGGAFVELVDPELGIARARPATCAADGSFLFELRGRPGGELPAFVAGRASAQGFAARPIILRPGAAAAIELWPCTPIVGTVVDASGMPVAGARVVWHSSMLAGSSALATSGADGRFAIECADRGDPGRLEAEASGNRRALAFDPAPRGPGGEREVTLRLVGERGLAGRVLWIWEGRVVEAERADGVLYPRHLPAAGLEVAVSKDSARRAAATDASGAFAFDELDPGHWTLSVPGAGVERLVEVDAASGVEPFVQLFAELPRNPFLGRLLAPDGAPLRDQAFRFGPDPAAVTAWGKTDADGQFEIAVPTLAGLHVRIRAELDDAAFSARLDLAGSAEVRLARHLPEVER